jgi:hypothetical protein
MTIATYSQEEKTDWIEIGETEELKGYYKVRSENTAWFKTVLKNDDKKYEGKVIRQSLMLMKFDCDGELYGQLKILFYDDDLEIIAQESVNELLVNMDYVTPDSGIERMYKTFCNSVSISTTHADLFAHCSAIAPSQEAT